jgi:hypothetical protein
MNAPEREQVRLSLLRLGQDRHGVSVGLLHSYLRGEGFARIERKEVEQEIQYLADKGFFVSETKALSPEVQLWRTTAEGRDALASAGQEV